MLFYRNRKNGTCFVPETTLKRGREMCSLETVSWVIAGIVGPVFLFRNHQLATQTDRKTSMTSFHINIYLFWYISNTLLPVRFGTSFERKGTLICTRWKHAMLKHDPSNFVKKKLSLYGGSALTRAHVINFSLQYMSTADLEIQRR